MSSSYNSFVKEHLALLRITNPEMDHKQRFSVSTDAWVASDIYKNLKTKGNIQRNIQRNGLDNLKSSNYNIFMKEQLASLRSTNPEMDHKQRLSTASDVWIASNEYKNLTSSFGTKNLDV